MKQWARSPEVRDQVVLFAERLDEAIPPDHSVRLLDAILERLDWSKWEACYHGRLGQPPIHPQVLAAALLYGLLKRVRSSRALEEALIVRLDFRWLVEGRTIDHSTLKAAAVRETPSRAGVRRAGCEAGVRGKARFHRRRQSKSTGQLAGGRGG